MIPTFDRDHLPSDPVTWPAWSKHAMTRALRIDGPFAVVTAEGALTCNDGFLAIDARGYPYPIAADEFARIYARHDATELQLSTFKRRDRLGRMRWYFHVAAENGEVVVQSEGYNSPGAMRHTAELITGADIVLPATWPTA